jgi:hypothetical protein
VSTLRVIRYASWSEFKRDLFVELYDDAVFRQGRYLFRGAGGADWRLATSFDRQFAAIPLERRMALWDLLIEQWRRGCAEAGIPDAVTSDDRKLWALGQHHGLPTRLLDWSTSPYVAAFFAFRDQLLAAAPSEVGQVAVWVMHLENPVWSRQHGVEVVTAPSTENGRMRNQNGRFTLCRAAFSCLEDYVERFAEGLALTKCVLPAAEAEAALSDLDAMGINSYDLFPDLTGLAAVATMRARLAAR